MESYYQIRDKTAIDSQYHDKVIEKLSSTFSNDYSEVITLDGVKGIIDENSWVLIRKSNTEDIIRISGESNNEEKCNSIINETTKMVKENYDKIR